MADGSIIIDTSIDSSGAEKGITGLGGKLGGMAKGALVGIAAATVAVGGLVKASIEQFSQFEQLTGGVETLFKSSRNIVMKYADDAYKTAGMSANEYMSTITGFSASLLQGLGGDTAKAAEVGNTAVTDMSDNANKMGTAIENIQNAYQGFAKQNYTMLDNLKLGYGGTKTEMQRLLVDAGKLSGMNYDIGNFSDVIEAIHVVQNEMGITGTTAKEASSTIEGSLNMTKSAWTNLLTNMAFDDADFDTLIGNLVDSVGALGENLLPRVEVILNGIGELITQLLPPIANKVPEILMSLLPKMVEAGTNIVTSLIAGIQTNLPIIATGAVEIASNLITALLTMLPQLLNIGIQIIAGLALGIGQALPALIPLAITCVMSLVNTIISNLPLILNAGLQIITGLVTGILTALPQLIAMLPTLITSIVSFIVTSLPIIIQTGVTLLLALINGLVTALPQLLAMLPQIIDSITTVISSSLPVIVQAAITILLAIINGLVTALPQLIAMLPRIIDSILKVISTNLPVILQAAITILLAIINGLVKALPQLIAMLPTIINTIVKVLTNNLPMIINAAVQIMIALIAGLIQAIPQLIATVPIIVVAIVKAFKGVNWGGIGINIIAGIGKGILAGVGSAVNAAVNAAKKIKNSITGFFDINSPSRVMRDDVGKFIPQGIGVGIDNEMPNLQKDIEKNLSGLTAKMRTTVDYETAKTTASVAAKHNFSVAKDNQALDETSRSNEKPTVVHVHLDVDGKEFTQTVVAPNQGVLDEYYEGR